MIRWLATMLPITALLCAAPLAAQIYPTPGAETPRVQTVVWQPNEDVVLTALPQSNLTVMLEPGETILRATLSESRDWEIIVSPELDSFSVSPSAAARSATLAVQTDYRTYQFRLEVGEGLLAAYLVRFDFEAPEMLRTEQRDQQVSVPVGGLDWSYRLRGDRSVRPISIRDNGEKTVIEYAVGQALPAVFAIGPSGEEEVVDGYMRDGKFVIDRVHQRLVFRIDREKARAERNKRPDEES